MAKVQKTYTVEFKREAARVAQTSGKLGISATSIHQWRKESTSSLPSISRSPPLR